MLHNLHKSVLQMGVYSPTNARARPPSSLPAAPSALPWFRRMLVRCTFCRMSYLAAAVHRPPDLHWCSMWQLRRKMSAHIMFCQARCLWPKKSQVNWPAVTSVWASLHGQTCPDGFWKALLLEMDSWGLFLFFIWLPPDLSWWTTPPHITIFVLSIIVIPC